MFDHFEFLIHFTSSICRISPHFDYVLCEEVQDVVLLAISQTVFEMWTNSTNGRSEMDQELKMIKHLASGSMGTVDLVQIGGTNYALKTISKTGKGYRADYVRKERKAGALLCHPNLVDMERSWEDDDNVYLLLGYVEGWDLLGLVEARNGDIEEDDCRYIFRQIIEGVAFLHVNGVAHRDLKLDNIVVDYAMHAKIIDFGFCELSNAHQCTTRVGSEEYCAPEIARSNWYNAYQADVWSLGIILFAILHGVFPFSISTVRRIKMGYTVPIPFGLSKTSFSARSLIESMLNVNPKKRPTIQEILNHEWLSNATPASE
eukprot:TRINITY_DN7107_c0_g1_i1.p1 TRINITY_DN7107_c0_g1~~TRINITY_DN7107_c0_g1_i1.p1  ORF type:complete len:317 (-),score=40.06 TRINITY_DN7107_c0_g1_i1:125-1075(-)